MTYNVVISACHAARNSFSKEDQIYLSQLNWHGGSCVVSQDKFLIFSRKYVHTFMQLKYSLKKWRPTFHLSDRFTAMGALAGLYNGLFKRTSTFALFIGVGVIGVRDHSATHIRFRFTKFSLDLIGCFHVFSLRGPSMPRLTISGSPKTRGNCGRTLNTNTRPRQRKSRFTDRYNMTF